MLVIETADINSDNDDIKRIELTGMKGIEVINL